MHLTLFCYSRDIEFDKIKLNLKKSGAFWWEVGRKIYNFVPTTINKVNVCVF